jgi:hypothetical protein
MTENLDLPADPLSVPAATVAARRVAEVRDDPRARRELLRSSYAPALDGAPLHLPYPRAALAFMDWQLGRGVLNPLDHERPGSPWWRAVNERLLRDTCEARLRLLGHPGPASTSSIDRSIHFAREPSPTTWYGAHNVTIVSAYLDHRDLAGQENQVERFFMNLVLVRVLYAHALVAAPRLALAWLAPIARWLGDPRLDMTGVFLSVQRVLPDRYPAPGELDEYVVAEHALGRLLDLGVIAPPPARAVSLGGRRAADPSSGGPVQRPHPDLRLGLRGRQRLDAAGERTGARRPLGPAAAPPPRRKGAAQPPSHAATPDIPPV